MCTEDNGTLVAEAISIDEKQENVYVMITCYTGRCKKVFFCVGFLREIIIMIIRAFSTQQGGQHGATRYAVH